MAVSLVEEITQAVISASKVYSFGCSANGAVINNKSDGVNNPNSRRILKFTRFVR